MTGNWDEFYKAIEKLARTPAPIPAKGPFEFDFTMDASSHNISLMEEVGYDLGKFVDKHPGSTIRYGSKLRPLEHLEPHLQHHHVFNHFAGNLQYGIDYPLNNTTNEACINVLEKSIVQGNHKSALSKEERPHVMKLVTT